MTQIGGMYIVGATDNQLEIMHRRGQFAQDYCFERGWDVDNLESVQLLEIRKQDGWKTPT